MLEKLPLFPLNTLLVPDTILPLQVFEERYLKLIKQCISDDSCFGIVPIRDGEEVGKPAMIYQIGVTAEITECEQDDNGMLLVTVKGRKKFRVSQTTVDDDQLMYASVEYLEDEPATKTPSSYSELVDLYESLRIHPEVQALNLPPAMDARQLGWFLIVLLPISRPNQISLLALNDPIQRLKALDDLLG